MGHVYEVDRACNHQTWAVCEGGFLQLPSPGTKDGDPDVGYNFNLRADAANLTLLSMTPCVCTYPLCVHMCM